MKKTHFNLILFSIISFSAMAQQLKYPTTKKENVVEFYHGVAVPDPFRWLEYDTAANVAEWVKQQNTVTQEYLSQIPYRQQIKNRLKEIWNYPKESAPFIKGNYTFTYKNSGLQNQSVLYKNNEVFIDPNKLSNDGTAALASFSIDKTNTYAAYGVAKSGSDWNEIFIKEIETGKVLNDHIKWVKFSGAAWYKDGFFYSRYDEPQPGKEYSSQNRFMKIYYHKLGNQQSQDELIYEDQKHPLRYFNASVTEDDRFLIISASEGTHGNEILIKDLTKPNSKFTVLVKGFSYNHRVVDNIKEKILLFTDFNAPNYRLVLVDPKKPSPKNWKDVIPEKDFLLDYVNTAGGKLFAVYLKDASNLVMQFNYSGKLEYQVKLPGIGTVSGFNSDKNQETFYYSFTSFTDPGSIHQYDIKTGVSIPQPSNKKLNINLQDFETKQVFYTSKDGTKVPMFIIHKKGLELNGNNPTLLYGYGGFNINLTPSFSISRMFFLEQGGIYCIANLRGGGEYGENWHKQGMLEKKQNVFNDFISAAEYLIENKYTNSNKLAIQGGSNGGLLVGACITQRPELFKVALPAVGVLDMLRFHKFTIGWGWVVEYGSSDVKEQFDYLIKYSPLHNVKPAKYPATMVLTADHDDRVVPAHSFKFLAALQENNIGLNPTIGRIDVKAGHGAGKPTEKLIEEAADIWSFILWNMGIKELKQ
ncbi:MAG: prolyl oligopeptidase family serine peptidase [Bacteroidia bacterium]